MQMRATNHSYRSNKSLNRSRQQKKYDKNYNEGFEALDENELGDEHYDDNQSDDGMDLRKKKS